MVCIPDKFVECMPVENMVFLTIFIALSVLIFFWWYKPDKKMELKENGSNNRRMEQN
jgi:hypothetical protein